MKTKKQIVNQLDKYFDSQIALYEKNISEYKKAADLDEDNVLDQEDLSFQNASFEMADHYTSLLEVAKFNKSELNKLNQNPSTKIELGALVDAGSILFFIGVPTSPLPYDEKLLFVGISIDSAFAQILKSKKIGQTFNYGKSKLTIKNIS